MNARIGDRTEMRLSGRTARLGRGRRLTRLGLIVALATAFGAASARSQVVFSPDLTLPLGTGVVHDEEAAIATASAATLFAAMPAIPSDTEVSGIHLDALGVLFAVDVTTTIEGLVVEPRDVVRWDGATLSTVLDGSTTGIPDGTRIDAVSLSAAGNILVSFDVSVIVGSLIVDDEDLIRLEPSPLIVFDGSAEGIDPALDLNGAGLTETGMGLVTFDGSGIVDGLHFDDEDILGWDVATGDFTMVLDGSALTTELISAELTAVPEPDPKVSISIGVLMVGVFAIRLRRSRHSRYALLLNQATPDAAPETAQIRRNQSAETTLTRGH